MFYQNKLPESPENKTGWPWSPVQSPYSQTVSTLDLPRITVVTPSFNQGQFIEETIRSVLLQGYPNLEYIIIDGGSLDGSVEIIKKYEPWLTYWVSEPDRGQSHAINKGFRLCQGEIITWLNSDDILQAGAIRQVSNFLCQNPDVGLAYGDLDIIDEQGNLINHVQTQEYDLLKNTSSGGIIGQPGTFLRKHVMDTVGLLRTDLHYVMDFEYWLRIGLHFPIRHIPVTLAAFRMWEGSKTISQSNDFGSEITRVIDDLYTIPDLPAELAMHKNQVYCGNYFLCGNYALRTDAIDSARSCFWEAISSYPPILFKSNILLLFLRTLLGYRIFFNLRSFKRFLYGRKRSQSRKYYTPYNRNYPNI